MTGQVVLAGRLVMAGRETAEVVTAVRVVSAGQQERIALVQFEPRGRATAAMEPRVGLTVAEAAKAEERREEATVWDGGKRQAHCELLEELVAV